MFEISSFYLTDLTVAHITFAKKETVHVSPRSFHSLSWRKSGLISVDRDYSAANTLTFIPQGCGYDTEILEDSEIIVAQFTLKEELAEKKPQIIAPSKPQLMEQLFHQLLEKTNYAHSDHFLSLSLFYRILYEWKNDRGNETPVRRISLRMKQAREQIERNFDDPALTVAALARQAGVSEVYFRREFSHCFDCSPLAYIRFVRLNNAKALLQDGRHLVTDVALLCGYESLSYFSYDFHQLTGVSPSAYKKKYEQIP